MKNRKEFMNSCKPLWCFSRDVHSLTIFWAERDWRSFHSCLFLDFIIRFLKKEFLLFPYIICNFPFPLARDRIWSPCCTSDFNASCKACLATLEINALLQFFIHMSCNEFDGSFTDFNRDLYSLDLVNRNRWWKPIMAIFLYEDYGFQRV